MKRQHFFSILSALAAFIFGGFTNPAVGTMSLPQKMYLELFTDEVKPSDHPTVLSRAQIKIVMASHGCSSTSLFGSFKPECQKAVAMVTEMLLAEKDTTRCIALAGKLKASPTLNPIAWYMAVTMVTFERADLRILYKPPPVDVVPDLFLNSLAIEEARRHPDQCVVLDERFGEDNGPENRLWYFREDIQVNSQHWFWHLTYPTNSTYHADRRGELFSFFHHQIITRYNTDRLANDLNRTKNIRLKPSFVIEEGYNPHLHDPISETNFIPRAPGTLLPPYVQSAVPGPTLHQLRTWNSRLIRSIDSKTFLYRNNATAPITFDALIDTVERSIWSINPSFYGSLHNNGHTYIAYSPVWQNPNSSVYGVMEELTTSMRDPVFYQWHGYLDTMFLRYKMGLPPYQLLSGDFPLIWDKVKFQKLRVLPKKTLFTFWSLKNFTLTRRLDLGSNDGRKFKVCAKYLNHENFKYKLAVVLDGQEPIAATVRIFLAPRYRENGKCFTLEEQMKWFFIMDSYKATLKPGKNILIRHSSMSALTVPWERSLATLGPNVTLSQVICGTGWPEHLLLPKGTPEGQTFDLVVMLTDGNEDLVGDEEAGTPQPNCISAPILGGVYHKKYPDRKPLGYPFDRVPFKRFKNLEEYVGMIPNMATTQIRIVHEDKIKKRH